MEGLIELYCHPSMIDTFNQSSKYLMSVVIAGGHEFEKKKLFLWNERNYRMNYICSHSWEKKITFAKHLICSRFIFNIISFSLHGIPCG